MKRAYIAIPAALAFAAAPFELPVPILPIAALIGIVPLAGCGSVPGSSPVVNITAVVNAVIAGVKAGCQVVPVAADVLALIPVYGPDAAAIITAICAAVSVVPTSGKLMTKGAMKGLILGHAPVTLPSGKIVHFE